MLDVARLVRIGDLDAAAAVHEAANRLASHRAARFIAEWLVEHSGPDPDLARLDEETGGALTRLATLTESARSRLHPRLHVESVTGRVIEVADDMAVVIDERGRRRPIPLPAPAATSSGAVVAADYEMVGDGAMTVWTRPAFDSEADPNERVPTGPHILTAAERDRLTRPVASAR